MQLLAKTENAKKMQKMQVAFSPPSVIVGLNGPPHIPRLTDWGPELWYKKYPNPNHYAGCCHAILFFWGPNCLLSTNSFNNQHLSFFGRWTGGYFFHFFCANFNIFQGEGTGSLKLVSGLMNFKSGKSKPYQIYNFVPK